MAAPETFTAEEIEVAGALVMSWKMAMMLCPGSTAAARLLALTNFIPQVVNELGLAGKKIELLDGITEGAETILKNLCDERRPG